MLTFLFCNVAEPALAFTHSPGCMFITDQKAETVSPLTLEPAQCPLTFCISQNPQLYSMASKRAVQQIRAIEELVVEDPGMKRLKMHLYSGIATENICFCVMLHPYH